MSTFIVLLVVYGVVAGGDSLVSFYVYEVPYEVQGDSHWCGPASLVMVLGYWDAVLLQEDVASIVYDSSRRLTNVSVMAAYPRNYGFNSSVLNGSIGCLKEWILRGCPVIVLQKYSLVNAYGHYRVVVGYDDEKEVFMTFDPFVGPNYNISYADFVLLWRPGETFQTTNWTLIVTPEDTSRVEEATAHQRLLNNDTTSTNQNSPKP